MSTLPEADIRAMVRLLGEVCVLKGGHAEKKRRLMDGLATLVDAEYWLWAMAAELEPGQFPVYVGFLSGGFSEQEMADFLKIQTHPDMIRYTIPLATELRVGGRHVTRSVQQMFSYEEFLASEVGQWWSAAGFQPRCIAFRPLASGGTTGIGLYRKTGRPLLTERETRIMHILVSEIPWLHELGWPEDRCATIPSLPRRCWLVHEMLVQGFDHKSIAQHLDLSPHTINDYIKRIYRHVGVHSQAALLRRFRDGDGGDR